MLTAEAFNQRMQRVQDCIAELAEQPNNPAYITASDLLRTFSELHAAGLQQMLTLIRNGGDAYRPLLEQFAQDDLIRSLLLCHDLHPVDLTTRLEEIISNLRPLLEAYGAAASLVAIEPGYVLVGLNVPASSGPSPVTMIQELLENAILVSAPDIAEVRFGQQPAGRFELPVIQ